MDTYTERLYENETIRLQWVYDPHYETIGSYAYDTDEETEKAEQWELERLNDGRLVALGCIVSVKADCDCPQCSGWHETDSLWGIVIEPDEKALDDYAEWNGWTKRSESCAS